MAVGAGAAWYGGMHILSTYTVCSESRLQWNLGGNMANMARKILDLLHG